MAGIRNPPRELGYKLVMTLTEEHFEERKALVLKPIQQAEEVIVWKLKEEDRAGIRDNGWARLTMRDFQDGSLYPMELSKHGYLHVLDDWPDFVQARNNNPSTYPLRPGMQVAFCVRDGILHFSARPDT